MFYERGRGDGRGSGRGQGDGRDDTRGRSAVVADLRRTLATMEGRAGEGGSRWGERRAAGKAVSGYDDVLAAPAPIAEVLPAGGIPRGSVVNVASAAPGGSGGTSLLLALLAAPRGVWSAVVGMPDLGVLAAAEMGVDLARLGLIPDPGPDVGQVLAVLADGVDVIVTAPPTRASLPAARQRVLTGRLRESGAVLLVAGRWPGADLALAVQEVRWSGIGQGHGYLRDRELDVQVAGRRAGAAMGAVVTLALRAGKNGVMVENAEPAGGRGRQEHASAVARADVG